MASVWGHRDTPDGCLICGGKGGSYLIIKLNWLLLTRIGRPI